MTIDYAKVADTLVALATEKGDQLNPTPGREHGLGCYYTTPEGGHCVAGETVVRLGGKLPQWGEYFNSRSFKMMVEEGFDIGIDLTPGAIALLNQCQSRADSGDTWGLAVRKSLAGGEVRYE